MALDNEEIKRLSSEVTGSLCSRTTGMDPADAVTIISNAVAGWLAVQITGMPTPQLRQRLASGFMGNLSETTLVYVAGIDTAGGTNPEATASSMPSRLPAEDVGMVKDDNEEPVDLDRLIAAGPAH